MLRAAREGKQVTLLHLGDHDPSGIDMTHDIWKRLNLYLGEGCVDWKELTEYHHTAMTMEVFESPFTNEGITVKRIALNHDQVLDHNPPPNPAKLTDSRIGEYLNAFGSESWELDSLEPATINDLIRDEIEDHLDEDIWGKTLKVQEKERKQISELIGQLRRGTT